MSAKGNAIKSEAALWRSLLRGGGLERLPAFQTGG